MFDAPRRVTLFDSGWSCFQHDRSVKSVGAIALSVQKYPDSRGICKPSCLVDRICLRSVFSMVPLPLPMLCFPAAGHRESRHGMTRAQDEPLRLAQVRISSKANRPACNR